MTNAFILATFGKRVRDCCEWLAVRPWGHLTTLVMSLSLPQQTPVQFYMCMWV